MKKFVYLILLQLMATTTYAQGVSVLRQLKDFYKAGPESLFIHTDRDFYFNGETIWYRTYLTNSSFYSGDPSIVAYVEITTADGTVLVRNKQKLNDGIGFGNFVLPESIPGGVYLLQAYTMSTKGIEQLMFKKELPIFNRVSPAQQLAATGLSATAAICGGGLKAVRGTKSLEIFFDRDVEGTLIGHSKGVVLFNYELSDITLPFVLNNITEDEIAIGLFDKGQNLQCATIVPAIQSAGYSFYIDYDAIVSPADNASVTLTLRDSLGEDTGGNFSVSIRRKSQIRSPQEIFFDGTINFGDLQKITDIKKLANKERYLYPKHPGSLQPVSFDEKMVASVNKTAAHSFALVQEEIDRYKLISRIDSAFDNREVEHDYVDAYLPFDNTYSPEDFQTLPTFEEFFIEVIKRGRIKRSQGKKKLLLRNTENTAAIYSYKDDPLILVDGYVATNLDAVLNLDPALIRRINVTWKTGTLSEAAIASLADNGIISIHSKGAALLTAGASGQGVYDGFHTPFRFSSLNRKRDTGEAPAFQDLLYWNPTVEVRGKQKLTFFTSDDIGQYVIDIVGTTFSGEIVRKQVTFDVRVKP